MEFGVLGAEAGPPTCWGKGPEILATSFSKKGERFFFDGRRKIVGFGFRRKTLNRKN